MIVKSLTIKNYRNHYYATFNFSDKINILEGENGVGKTNVAEAICYLSLVRSFQGSEDKEVIKYNEKIASIDADIIEGENKKQVRVQIGEDKKLILLNNKKITKLSDLSKIVNVVLFEPRDAFLFKESPKKRRMFLDMSISKQSSPYLDYLSRYNKVLDQRNSILKSEKIDKTLLKVTTEMLIKLAGPIVSYRTMYLKDINDILNIIARALTGTRSHVYVRYSPFVEYDENFYSKALESYEKTEDYDIKHKATSIGIQREDFKVYVDGKDIGIYGSQGQNRIIALALKLSPYFLIKENEKKPIVILDDVMSELDEKHQTRLIEFLKKLEQVFITTTKLRINGANHYEIKAKKEAL